MNTNQLNELIKYIGKWYEKSSVDMIDEIADSIVCEHMAKAAATAYEAIKSSVDITNSQNE